MIYIKTDTTFTWSFQIFLAFLSKIFKFYLLQRLRLKMIKLDKKKEHSPHTWQIRWHARYWRVVERHWVVCQRGRHSSGVDRSHTGHPYRRRLVHENPVSNSTGSYRQSGCQFTREKGCTTALSQWYVQHNYVAATPTQRSTLFC